MLIGRVYGISQLSLLVRNEYIYLLFVSKELYLSWTNCDFQKVVGYAFYNLQFGIFNQKSFDLSYNSTMKCPFVSKTSR